MTDREELLRRASKLVPKLRERAAQTEEMRRLPGETVQDYLDAELLRAAQPARYGGLDLDFDVLLDVAMELSRGCGSAGVVLHDLGEPQLRGGPAGATKQPGSYLSA